MTLYNAKTKYRKCQFKPQHKKNKLKSEGGRTIVCVNSHFPAKYVHETNESNANECNKFHKPRIVRIFVRVERSDYIIGEYKGIWRRVSNCEEEASEEAAG